MMSAAFALDQYAAYEAFSVRKLQSGESADVFLTDLRRLAAFLVVFRTVRWHVHL